MRSGTRCSHARLCEALALALALTLDRVRACRALRICALRLGSGNSALTLGTRSALGGRSSCKRGALALGESGSSGYLGRALALCISSAHAHRRCSGRQSSSSVCRRCGNRDNSSDSGRALEHEQVVVELRAHVGRLNDAAVVRHEHVAAGVDAHNVVAALGRGALVHGRCDL